jgi:gliding-associated putative ABC transporter substrate-binding component GldG
MGLLSSKKQVNRANALLAIIVVIILVLVINVFSTQLFGRWDVTENKDFSITDTTEDVLKGLDDVVNIKAYFTEELPGYLLNKNLEVKDILTEYEEASNGNVVVTFLDPSHDSDTEAEARGMGIPTLQFNVVEEDKFQVTNGYLGVGVFYGDDREIIPIIQDTSSLEYDLTAAISKVTREEIPTVGFYVGKGAWTSGELSQVRGLLERQYRIRDVDLSDGSSVPQNVSTLIIPGVKENLSEREKYAIDQYLMSGGDILVLAEGTSIDPGALTVEKNNTGIGELVAQWGVRLNKNLALDNSNELAAFRTDQVQFFSPYPFWIKVPKAGFNPESGIVNKLESLVVTWASTLEVLEEKLTEATAHVDLVRTTENAWTQDGDWVLNPRAIPQPEAGTESSFVLATMLSGHFESLYSKDEIPNKIVTDEEGVESEEPVSSEDRDKFLASTEEGRVIVVSDSEFALDINLNRFESNTIFFQNLVDALTSDEALINIRSKTVTDRPLKELNETQKNWMKWGNIAGVSVLFTLYGLMRYNKRRKNKVVISS